MAEEVAKFSPSSVGGISAEWKLNANVLSARTKLGKTLRSTRTFGEGSQLLGRLLSGSADESDGAGLSDKERAERRESSLKRIQERDRKKAMQKENERAIKLARARDFAGAPDDGSSSASGSASASDVYPPPGGAAAKRLSSAKDDNESTDSEDEAGGREANVFIDVGASSVADKVANRRALRIFENISHDAAELARLNKQELEDKVGKEFSALYNANCRIQADLDEMQENAEETERKSSEHLIKEFNALHAACEAAEVEKSRLQATAIMRTGEWAHYDEQSMAMRRRLADLQEQLDQTVVKTETLVAYGPRLGHMLARVRQQVLDDQVMINQTKEAISSAESETTHLAKIHLQLSKAAKASTIQLDQLRAVVNKDRSIREHSLATRRDIVDRQQRIREDADVRVEKRTKIREQVWEELLHSKKTQKRQKTRMQQNLKAALLSGFLKNKSAFTLGGHGYTAKEGESAIGKMAHAAGEKIEQPADALERVRSQLPREIQLREEAHSLETLLAAKRKRLADVQAVVYAAREDNQARSVAVRRTTIDESRTELEKSESAEAAQRERMVQAMELLTSAEAGIDNLWRKLGKVSVKGQEANEALWSPGTGLTRSKDRVIALEQKIVAMCNLVGIRVPKRGLNLEAGDEEVTQLAQATASQFFAAGHHLLDKDGNPKPMPPPATGVARPTASSAGKSAFTSVKQEDATPPPRARRRSSIAAVPHAGRRRSIATFAATAELTPRDAGGDIPSDGSASARVRGARRSSVAHIPRSGGDAGASAAQVRARRRSASVAPVSAARSAIDDNSYDSHVAAAAAASAAYEAQMAAAAATLNVDADLADDKPEAAPGTASGGSQRAASPAPDSLASSAAAAAEVAAATGVQGAASDDGHGSEDAAARRKAEEKRRGTVTVTVPSSLMPAKLRRELDAQSRENAAADPTPPPRSGRRRSSIAARAGAGSGSSSGRRRSTTRRRSSTAGKGSSNGRAPGGSKGSAGQADAGRGDGDGDDGLDGAALDEKIAKEMDLNVLAEAMESPAFKRNNLRVPAREEDAASQGSLTDEELFDMDLDGNSEDDALRAEAFARRKASRKRHRARKRRDKARRAEEAAVAGATNGGAEPAHGASSDDDVTMSPQRRLQAYRNLASQIKMKGDNIVATAERRRRRDERRSKMTDAEKALAAERARAQQRILGAATEPSPLSPTPPPSGVPPGRTPDMSPLVSHHRTLHQRSRLRKLAREYSSGGGAGAGVKRMRKQRTLRPARIAVRE